MAQWRTVDAWDAYGPALPNQYLRMKWWTFERLASGLVHSAHR